MIYLLSIFTVQKLGGHPKIDGHFTEENTDRLLNK